MANTPGNPNDPTRLIRKAETEPANKDTVMAPRPSPDGDGKTRLVGPADLAGTKPAASSSSEDPVVGWVVVVDGPGKGNSLPLGYGMNDVARSSSARVPLDFGDDLIARSQHAIITFDPRSLKFFVQHGTSKNLTYLGDAPVLAPQELANGQEISLGATRLRFVALCGPDFDWQKL